MAHYITLTPTPITVSPTGTATKENLWEALDVSMFDMLDMTLGILANSVPSANTVTMQLITSVQKEIDDASWIPTLGTNFANVAGTATNWQLINLNMGFLRYLRWSVTSTGTSGSITFVILGMARRYGG